MKVGLLLCDHTREFMRPQFGDYPERFVALFHELDPAIQVEIFDVSQDVFPDNCHQADVFVISGSKTSCYEKVEWVQKLCAFIVECYQQKGKIAGICFGHQIMAQAMGGNVTKSSKGWGVGVHTYMFTRSEPAFDNLGSFSLLVSHQDQVITAPTCSKLLAGSDFCPNAMLGYGDTMISVQGHPELTKEYARAILELRRADIGEQAYQQALLDYKKKPDNQTLTRGMLRFLQLM